MPAARLRTASTNTARSRVVRCLFATRYNKLAVRYQATVLVAAISEWL